MSTPIDRFADLVGLGPNDWIERLRPSIELTSPDGNIFTPKWIGNSRSVPKKLGIFEYPKIPGTILQDLDVSSTTYDITLYFSGKNNDTESDRFFRSIKERGPWAVTHPVHGFIELQLISATQNVFPVESGNITSIETKWIEPLDEQTLKTAAELKSEIGKQAKIFNAQAALQFADTIRDTAKNLEAYIEATTNLISNATEAVMAPLFATTDAVNSLMNATQSGIQDTLTAVVFKPITLAGQMQQLIQLPLLARRDVPSRLDYYADLITEYNAILARTSGDTNTKAINNAVIGELSLSSVIAANAQIVETGNLLSRSDAIEFAVRVAQTFSDITDTLDSAQDDMAGNDIDRQYFSQSGAYSDAALLTAKTLEYLLSSAFELKIEKRFILTEPRNPIEIAFAEYGGPGDDDENLDFFITTNALKGYDIIQLPAGREVVVYV